MSDTVTTDDTARVVAAYYDTLSGGTTTFDPDVLRTILAPDLAFEGPIAGSVTGAERFVVGVTGFVETMSGMTVHHRLVDGDQAAALYDATLPGGLVRFAEFFRVTDGRITSLRLLYDADDYVSKGGR